MPPHVPAARVEATEGMPLKAALLRALEEAEGDVTAVARRFGVSRVTLYAWMRAHGIRIERRVVAD